MGEAFLGALLCGFLGGSEAEARLDFQNLGKWTYMRADCLTRDFAFEFGLDRISSRDSIHQALLAAELTIPNLS